MIRDSTYYFPNIFHSDAETRFPHRLGGKASFDLVLAKGGDAPLPDLPVLASEWEVQPKRSFGAFGLDTSHASKRPPAMTSGNSLTCGTRSPGCGRGYSGRCRLSNLGLMHSVSARDGGCVGEGLRPTCPVWRQIYRGQPDLALPRLSRRDDAVLGTDLCREWRKM